MSKYKVTLTWMSTTEASARTLIDELIPRLTQKNDSLNIERIED